MKKKIGILLGVCVCALLACLPQGGLAKDAKTVRVAVPVKAMQPLQTNTTAQKGAQSDPATQAGTTNPKAKGNNTKAAAPSLPVYDPAKDAAPAEGLPIEETNFQFSEPLLVRPKTDTIVIHHVGVPDGDTSAAAIHRAHLANGWAGVGYHYVIRKNGLIERGRPLATVGAHAYGENYHTVGINVTGNFDKEIPTKAQLESLTELVTALCRIYHIEPSATTIVGHRDLNDTDCPGKNLYALLPQLRADVKAQLLVDRFKDTHILKLHKQPQAPADTSVARDVPVQANMGN